MVGIVFEGERVVGLQAGAGACALPADEGGGFGQRGIARVALDPVAAGVFFFGTHQVQGTAAFPARGETTGQGAFEAIVAALLVLYIDGQGSAVDGDDLVRPDVVQRGLGVPVQIGVAPAQFHLAALDTGQGVVFHAQAGLAVVLGRVRQVETFAVVAPQLMAILEVVDGTGIVQVDLIVVAATRNALEITHVDVHQLAPGTTGEREVFGGLPVQLGIARQAVDPVAWVARCLARGVQVQPATFGRGQGVEGTLLGVEALAVQVHAIGQLQGIPLLGKQRLEAADLEVLLGTGEVHAARAHRLAAVVVRERIEVVVLLAIGRLQVEVLPQHIAVVVVAVEQKALGTRFQVGGVATAQLGVLQVGGPVVGQVGEVDAGAAMVAGIVILRQQVEVLLLVELQPQAAKYIDGTVVLQVGLGIVDEDLVAGTIVEGFVLLARYAQAPIDALVAAADGLGGAGCQVVTVVEAAGGTELSLEARRARFAFFGDDVDDTAGGASTINGVGTGQHFNALDVERRDAVELPRKSPGAVLADPVDHHQHIAPAHVLAIVGAPFRRQVQARYQLADSFLEAHAGIDLLAQLGLIDHPDRPRNFTDGRAGARSHADFDRLEVERLHRRGRAQDYRALVTELPAHASTGQQHLQGIADAERPVQFLALQTRHIRAAEQQVQAGLIGKAGQRLVQFLGRQRQCHHTALRRTVAGNLRGFCRLDSHGGNDRSQGGRSHQGMAEQSQGNGRRLEQSFHCFLPDKMT
ncbi:hypothetical protein D9M71_250240 [compost metagenome]